MSTEPDAYVLAPHGACTVRESGEMRAALIAALRRGAVVLDCAEVTDIDLSFVQLVLAARNSAAQHRFTVTAPPGGALAQILARGGFRVGPDQHVPPDPALWCAPAGAA